MSERVKPIEVMKRNICPVCAKIDCIFLTRDKHCKEMMELSEKVTQVKQ
ncbi:hypothetical protein QSH14_01390 [Proteus faecis]|uniref:Phage protein n=1 Tax=Proteus faecis TaxID=2050967 RepID=A0AAW7CVA4_9GAMM|nr:hypothetical protein [Proteus faecis]MDL5165740.1 hypothetical protein [Proteus faecis]MDL5273996.1 hypothetical protein [Proteus faecis]MDL5277566.1 hypothetical protein [Proteus faecis]MDL5306555.1 hypothetical protein [Proteus faecis]MDL5310124.1 hypothetical protein [Proteus faecis]